MEKSMEDDSTRDTIIDDFMKAEHAAMDAKSPNSAEKIDSLKAFGAGIDYIVSSFGLEILIDAITGCEKMSQTFLRTTMGHVLTQFTVLTQPDVAKAIRNAVENRSLRPLRCLSAIDIITQFTNKETVLAPENVSVMLYQVKNSPSFDATVVPAIFSITDPMRLKIFHGRSAHPVIRIVMSLAEPEPEIVFVKPPTRRPDHPRMKHEFKDFSSYDIWFAGISPETYRPMSASDAPHHQSLLQRSQGLSGAYDLFEEWTIRNKVESRERRSELRKQMNPGTAVSKAHWSYLQSNPENEDTSSIDC